MKGVDKTETCSLSAAVGCRMMNDNPNEYIREEL
jgi:hypothetical protein